MQYLLCFLKSFHFQVVFNLNWGGKGKKTTLSLYQGSFPGVCREFGLNVAGRPCLFLTSADIYFFSAKKRKTLFL